MVFGNVPNMFCVYHDLHLRKPLLEELIMLCSTIVEVINCIRGGVFLLWETAPSAVGSRELAVGSRQSTVFGRCDALHRDCVCHDFVVYN